MGRATSEELGRDPGANGGGSTVGELMDGGRQTRELSMVKESAESVGRRSQAPAHGCEG